MDTAARLLLLMLIVYSGVHLTKAETNIALNKPSSSSYEANRHPRVLNDGDLATNWGSGTCFNAVEQDALAFWWQVDLQDLYLVGKIKVTNRGDCCPQRLRDFSLDMFQDNPLLVPTTSPKNCYFHAGPVAGGVTKTLICYQPVAGRYLRITKATSQLQLCELQVFALPFEACTFSQTKGMRLNTDTALVLGVVNTNKLDCAGHCSRNTNCTAFNIEYQPNVTCQLLQDPDVENPEVDPSWDYYLMQPCWNVCGVYI